MSQYSRFQAPGLSYLLEPCGSIPVFAPEYFNEDQQMIQKTASDFVLKTVAPHDADIEVKKEGLIRSLVQKAGELGLLAVDVPEEYGGLGGDKTTSNIVAESLVGQGSFMVAHATHTQAAHRLQCTPNFILRNLRLAAPSIFKHDRHLADPITASLHVVNHLDQE